MTRFASLVTALTVLSSPLCTATFLFNTADTDISGIWKGKPSSTILGPWGSDPMAFVVQPLNDSSGWLISDVFGDSPILPDTFQRFYLQRPVSPSGPSFTYCGRLGRDYNARNLTQYSYIRFLAYEAESSNASITVSGPSVYLPPGGTPFNVSITVALVDATHLRLTVKFDIANHLDVLLTRAGDVTGPFPSPPNSRSPTDGGYLCDRAPVRPGQDPSPFYPPSSQLQSPSRCPFRAPPLQAASSSSPSNNNPNTTLSPRTTNPGDSVCYVMQPFVGLRVSWIVPSPSDTHITITVSAPVPASSSAGSGSYLALGFPGRFPTMGGLTAVVALYDGKGSTKVASFAMPAGASFGAPLPDASAIPLTDTSSSFADGVLSFTFTRPIATTVNPIRYLPANIPGPGRPFQYFAMGSLGTDGGLQYHGGMRGMFTQEFYHPSSVWAPEQMCPSFTV